MIESIYDRHHEPRDPCDTSNADLLKIAERHPAPQEWYDEDGTAEAAGRHFIANRIVPTTEPLTDAELTALAENDLDALQAEGTADEPN